MSLKFTAVITDDNRTGETPMFTHFEAASADDVKGNAVLQYHYELGCEGVTPQATWDENGAVLLFVIPGWVQAHGMGYNKGDGIDEQDISAAFAYALNLFDAETDKMENRNIMLSASKQAAAGIDEIVNRLLDVDHDRFPHIRAAINALENAATQLTEEAAKYAGQ